MRFHALPPVFPLALALLCSACAGPGYQPEDAPPPAVARSAPVADTATAAKTQCRMESSTGSNVKKRVCTAPDAERGERDREALERLQSRGGVVKQGGQ